jgi:hypothetical protein
MSKYLDNMGKPPGKRPPNQVDHLFKERDEELAVVLFVTRSTVRPYNPRNNHWILAWELGTYGINPIHRRIGVVQEAGIDHLTNWGPLTKSASTATVTKTIGIHVKTMTLDERQKLEEIAGNTQVLRPDGEWNCQNWLITVLETAEAQGLIMNEEWSAAVDEAMNVVE